MASNSSTTTKPVLSLETLRTEAAAFAEAETLHDEPSLYGVDNGKAVGTYLEHKFVSCLMDKYTFAGGNSALGIDIPQLGVDIKVTSQKQPQSSCPFTSARQKIYGLGYHLIIFVYDKSDNPATQTSRLTMTSTIFVDAAQTADFQTTKGIRDILERNGNEDDLLAFIEERRLPVDEIEAAAIAKELLKTPPMLGYLTISNALQWRLQYSRVIDAAGTVPGIYRIYTNAS
ncbi:MAG TPA: hypothetical protein VIJ79_17830 [Acidobacteriaceae bacterium]